MNILYINAAARKNSRTAELARYAIERLGGEATEVRTADIDFPAADEDFLAKRDRACAIGDFSDNMFALAKQFAIADEIVIAAPFWDLSFPSSLKQYFEQINVVGLTFAYTDDGRPMSLCNAKRLIYVTTAGGTIFSENYGFGYVRALADSFYGIPETVMFKAEGLDICGADVGGIMAAAKREIAEYFDKKQGEEK